jgi:hypothetical protein
MKRRAALQAGDLLAQEFIFHAEFAETLVGDTQSGLHRVIFCCAVLESGVQSSQGALAPLLQSVRFDCDLARDCLDRLTPQGQERRPVVATTGAVMP